LFYPHNTKESPVRQHFARHHVPNHQQPNIFFCCYRQIGVSGATCAGRYLYACFRCTTITSQFNLFLWRLIEKLDDWKQERACEEEEILARDWTNFNRDTQEDSSNVSIQQYVSASAITPAQRTLTPSRSTPLGRRSRLRQPSQQTPQPRRRRNRRPPLVSSSYTIRPSTPSLDTYYPCRDAANSYIRTGSYSTPSAANRARGGGGGEEV
jgi:hypothetical protein